MSDPFASSTVLDLQLNGNFTDLKGHAVTPVGNAYIRTDNCAPLIGNTTAAYFDGVSYLSAVNSSDFQLGYGNFTMEAWIYLTEYPSNNAGMFQSIILSKDTQTEGRSFSLELAGTAASYTGVTFMGYDSNSTYTAITSPFSFALNTWYHVAAVRAGNFIYLFVNGTLLNTNGTAFTRTIQNISATLKVGALMFNDTYLYYFKGYISHVKITKDIARYTSNFIPAKEDMRLYTGYMSGIVTEEGVAVSRLIRAYDRESSALLKEVMSDVNGKFEIFSTNPNPFFIVILDNNGGVLYNAKVYDNVNPLRLTVQ